MTIDEQIEEYAKRVYPDGGMSAHTRGVYRKMLERDEKFWERQWVHEELQAKHGEVRR